MLGLKILALLAALLYVSMASDDEYIVGSGIGDITGPSVEINFMGYAVPSQRGSGIHLRLRSRALSLTRVSWCATCELMTYIRMRETGCIGEADF